MMKLGLMKRFFDHVDADWRCPIADEIALRWFADGARVRCRRASANFVFHVAASTGEYFLRFNHESERSPDAFAGEIEFVIRLVDSGIRASIPIRALSGSFVESVPTEMGVFHATVFEALRGRHIECDEMSEDEFHLWGRTLGEMHVASQGPLIAGRPTWQDHLQLASEWIPSSESALREVLSLVDTKLSDLPTPEEEFGLIHYDCESDNLMWKDGQCGILDFDDAAYYWYVADIAYALSDFYADYIDPSSLNEPGVDAFLAGYRSAKPLEDGQVSLTPTFRKVHDLVSIAKLRRTLEEGPLADEPEWTVGLRKKLEGALEKLCCRTAESSS